MPIEGLDYNERLFKKGLRSSWHFARFFWLEKTIKDLRVDTRSVVELGCYDGKTINFIQPVPLYYVGYDANWEDGFDIARNIWKNKNYVFSLCNHPDQIKETELFDIAICMETLEHIPSELVDLYVEKLSKITKGYFFVTVPVEKGPVFFLKHLGKILFGYSHEEYTLKEFILASIGFTKNVHRHEHKGFDYNEIIKTVSKHFEIIKVEPHPVRFFPKIFGIGIGIVARKIK
jgi:hypothetical protein